MNTRPDTPTPAPLADGLPTPAHDMRLRGRAFVFGDNIDTAPLAPGPYMRESVAVLASHVGFPFNPVVFAVLANHLVAPHERWAVCRSAHMRPFVREVSAGL